ncbi:MAG: DUF4232 domain-containing protein [Gordonia polyisoprenivorans]|nr:DUF4232 domain-containing protein [Gordonia polyisoprenivorans]
MTLGHRANANGAQSSLSHAGVRIVFTNHSTTTCTLFGYPGAAALNAHGKQFRQARRTRNGYLAGRDHGKPRTIVLEPGEKAMSVIEGTSMNAHGRVKPCRTGRALLVTPPNTTHPTRVRFRDYFCHLEVHPVVHGATLRTS